MDNEKKQDGGEPSAASDGYLAYSSNTPEYTFMFDNKSSEVARISPDGIMRFTVEANDENAAKFVECIESFIEKRLSGIEVETKSK